MDSRAAAVGGTADCMGGVWLAVLLVRGVLATVPHRETAFRIHDAVQGQEQRPHGFSAGPLAAAEFAADSAGHVCAAHAAGDHSDGSAGGVAADGGCQPVRNSGGGLGAAASTEAARGATHELAQAGIVGDDHSVAVDRAVVWI